MQLPAVQPTPTRCPTVSPLAARPTSTTRPTASCPSTAGNRENPQSLSRIDRSEWHSPQCSTSTSTSSSPSGPSSTFCRTKRLLAAGATHASIIAIAILRQGELIVAHPRTNGSVGRVGLIDLRIHRGLRGLNHGLDGAIPMVCLGGATADPSIESELPPVYAGGSTALKTISMSCSGKASLDTPIRLLAH